MTGDPRLVRALLACYPAGWRQRYGDEYAQLLCDLRIHRRPLLIVDSLRGALRAQLSHGGPLMSTRSPMTTAVWAAGLFTVAGIGFQKLTEDGTAPTLVIVAAAIALLALVTAAAPTAVALLRGRDAGAWKYLAVPVVGVAAWYGVVRLALAISHGHDVHSAATVTGFALVAVAGVAVLVATAWAASTVLRRVPAAQPTHLRPVALALLAAGMAGTTVVALVWGLRAPAGDQGILATPFVPSWITTVVLMAAATAIATVASRRQFAAAR
ncbi:hypothetical protein DFJ67_6908 [Asanoa ferruginea]|uniref:Uncharacterized protein n=1 Tax=Asanoa ferruginea TaxID=53367 RepID=A0A3E0A3G7_9ACTN|nr:hypothetical protein [Asanoa ferruginea]REG00851.1 hypothetical protein DFJ67_6908 [Asanoa ferruginea]GIF47274.1 hypothetical protein Afe04nite_18130 [Asanoa ferruginea]